MLGKVGGNLFPVIIFGGISHIVCIETNHQQVSSISRQL